MPANEIPLDIRQAVAISNLKSVAEQPAMLANLAFSNLLSNLNLSQQNAVSNQQAMNQLTLSITSKAINNISNVSPAAAISEKSILTNNKLAEQIAQLRRVIEEKVV